MNRPSESPRSPTAAAADTTRTSDPFGLADLIADGILDALPGDPPVPIKQWRITDADHGGGLTIRTALLLVALYTRPGDTIVSLGNDPALAGAAGAAGCRYVPVAHPADLADLDHVAGTVGLIVLRWPVPPTANRRRSPARPADMSSELTDLFTACRLLLSNRDGYTIVALTPAVAGPDYTEHARLLLPAARQAGLGWLQHIVAVTGADPPTATSRATPRPDTTASAAVTATDIDLLVFVIRGNPPSPEGAGGERRQPTDEIPDHDNAGPGSSE